MVYCHPKNMSLYCQAKAYSCLQFCFIFSSKLIFRNPSLSADHTWTETYWPLHTPLKRETLTLSTSESKVLEGHGVRKCAFWKKFLPQLGNGRFDGRSGDFFPLNNGAVPPAVDKRPETGQQKACELECCNAGLLTGQHSKTVLFSSIIIIFFKSRAF